MKSVQDSQNSEKKLVPLGQAKNLTKGNYGAYREGWETGFRWGAIP
jgi:hypothetical protein